MHLIDSYRWTTHRSRKKTQYVLPNHKKMSFTTGKERLFDDLDVDPDVDLPRKRSKQSSAACRTCYGIFTVVAVTFAILFTLIVVADLIDFASRRDDKGHEYGYFVKYHYYIFGTKANSGDNSVTQSSGPLSPPPYTDKARTARYIVHNTDWGTISTFSTKLSGIPFGTPESFCDGPENDSTGIPYFYLTPFNPSATDVLANPSASLTVTEAQTGYCAKKKWDPEDPQCAKVCLSGKMLVLKTGSKEEQFAKSSLFARHPQMKDWPTSHDWLFLKLNITNVWMLDYYGPATEVPIKDYFAAQP